MYVYNTYYNIQLYSNVSSNMVKHNLYSQGSLIILKIYYPIHTIPNRPIRLRQYLFFLISKMF